MIRFVWEWRVPEMIAILPKQVANQISGRNEPVAMFNRIEQYGVAQNWIAKLCRT